MAERDDEQLLDKFVRWRNLPLVGKWVRYMVRILFGATIHQSTYMGEGTRIMHGNSTNIHPPVIGKNCTIYQNVTIGRSDLYGDEPEDFAIVIEDYAVVSVGVVVAAPDEGLVIGEGTVIAANSVLKESTGEWEVWGGLPAKRIGERKNRAEILARHGEVAE